MKWQCSFIIVKVSWYCKWLINSSALCYMEVECLGYLGVSTVTCRSLDSITLPWLAILATQAWQSSSNPSHWVYSGNDEGGRGGHKKALINRLNWILAEPRLPTLIRKVKFPDFVILAHSKAKIRNWIITIKIAFLFIRDKPFHYQKMKENYFRSRSQVERF